MTRTRNRRSPRPRRAASRKSSRGAGSKSSAAPLGVCFDLDGVLINSMPLHAQAWQDALGPLGIRVSRRAIYEWEGEPGMISARKLLSRAVPGTPWNTKVSPEDIAALLLEKERRFKSLGRGIRVPAVLQRMLKRLRQRGLRLALVTGTSSREVRRVVPAGSRRIFDAIITGDRVRHGKPHPEPYLTAMRRLGLPPGRVWVVENAPYGIRSGRRAGAGRVIALASSLPSRYLREAHTIVRTVPELIRLLDRVTIGFSRPAGTRYNTLTKELLMARQGFIALGLALALFASAPAVSAQDPIHKMGRGLTNVLTGWIEIPKQIHEGSQRENPMTGMGGGLFKGTSLTLLRTGMGLFETITFPISYPADFGSPYEPMELSDYAWE